MFETLNSREQKKVILKKYLGREPQKFCQFDWGGPGELYACETSELMQTLGLRVLVHPNISRDEVLAGLKMIVEWIERDVKILGPIKVTGTAGGSFSGFVSNE